MLWIEYLDQIGIVHLNLPPVNALGYDLRCLFQNALNEIEKNEKIKAVIIISDIAIFSGGADIKEFDNDLFWKTPNLHELLNRFDQFPKLTISAIHGVAMGGGLELALACDYRIASKNTLLGLPEVHLGLLPGAGGTQRLPRFVSIKKSVDMILSGKPIDAHTAHQEGLIDYLVEQDQSLKLKALEYAQQCIRKNATKRSNHLIKIKATNEEIEFIEQERAKINQPSVKWLKHKKHCLEAIHSAIIYDTEKGLSIEKNLFRELLLSNQSKAMRHIFFAEKNALKIPDIPKSTPIRTIQSVAIIGAGTMGVGIAIAFLQSHFPVLLIDKEKKQLDKAKQNIKKYFDKLILKKQLSENQVASILQLFDVQVDFNKIKEIDLVIEAVFENMHLKKSIIQSLNPYCHDKTIIASNTSSLNINILAQESIYPQNVIGIHFFSPAHLMPLVEIVRAEKTGIEVIQTALQVAQKINKKPVVVNQCYGFVGNRMFEPYFRESARLLLEGAPPEQIDTALLEFGMSMGPLSTADLIGTDVCYMMREETQNKMKSIDLSYHALQNELYHMNCLGQKNNQGFYHYKEKQKTSNPEIIKIAQNIATKLKIKQRNISNQEIVERCIFSLINEAIEILHEKIAYRASDCDFIWVQGYGFPIWKGGPLFYGNQIGMNNVLEKIRFYKNKLGEYGEIYFQPSPLLLKIVEQNQALS